MVKVIDRGGKTELREKKPIELVKYIDEIDVENAEWCPKDFDKVELLECDIDNYDLILCTKDKNKYLYYGNWNDGVVE